MDYIIEEANKINNVEAPVEPPTVEPPTVEPPIVVPPAIEPSTPSKKSNEEMANEVIAGKWGNGEERKAKLTAAGYDYSAIQAIVNEKLGGSSSPEKPSKKSNEVIAQEVIKGDWGNGEDRKNRLVAAGYDYVVIQKMVNDKLK